MTLGNFFRLAKVIHNSNLHTESKIREEHVSTFISGSATVHMQAYRDYNPQASDVFTEHLEKPTKFIHLQAKNLFWKVSTSLLQKIQGRKIQTICLVLIGHQIVTIEQFLYNYDILVGQDSFHLFYPILKNKA